VHGEKKKKKKSGGFLACGSGGISKISGLWAEFRGKNCGRVRIMWEIVIKCEKIGGNEALLRFLEVFSGR
jgi:hypothetical protein